MKSAIVLVVLLALAGGALFVVSQSPGGGSVGTLVLTGKRAFLRDRTLEFLEDIKFKDFPKASTYHLKEAQEARDIPSMLKRAFKIRHEVLDIQEYEVLEVELDSTETRGRVRTLVRFHVLGDKEVRERADAHRDMELMFYWFEQADGTWTMELESSLRG